MMRATVILMLLTAGAATTQESPAALDTGALHLSLAEAVQRALTQSAGLRELEQLRIAAGADVASARAERRPTANVGAGYTRRSDINEFLIPQPQGQPPVGFLNLPGN